MVVVVVVVVVAVGAVVGCVWVKASVFLLRSFRLKAAAEIGKHPPTPRLSCALSRCERTG